MIDTLKYFKRLSYDLQYEFLVYRSLTSNIILPHV